MRAVKAVGLLMVLVAPLAWAARAPDPLAQRAEALSREVQQASRSPAGAAKLIDLYNLKDSLEDLTPLVQTFAWVSERRTANPYVRDLARHLIVDVERARGRLHRAREASEQLGWIDQFYVTGGFDNEGKGGCDTDFGPEASLDLAAHYPGAAGREVGWHPLRTPEGSAPTSGFIDLSSAVSPSREAVGYALTFLTSPDERAVTLALGTSGAHRLFVNGQKVASDDRYSAPRPDQSRYEVRLRKGVNRVMVKVCQENGLFGFYLRKENAPEIAVTLPPTLPELEKGRPATARPLPTLTATLEREVQTRPNDARLRGAYAQVLDFVRAYEERLHIARDEAERAALSAPKDVSLQLLAAELHREDLNERHRFLEAARQADPESSEVLLALADLELVRDHPDRALPLVEQVLQKQPNLASARLMQVRTLEGLGESARAQVLLDAALRDAPRSPRLLREAVRAAQRHDRIDEAIGRARVVLAVRFDDRAIRLLLASMLADQARIDEAAREIRTVLSLDPFDNGTRVRLGELLVANARTEEGLAAFAAARELAPDQPELHEREGRALLLAGNREEGIASLEQALVLRPQNPPLREMLRALRGESGGGAPEIVEVAPLIAEADRYQHEDAVYLVDSTHTRVQKTGLSSRFTQLAVKVFTQRGVETFRSYPISYAPSRQDVRVLRARVTKPDGSVFDSSVQDERNLNEPWTGMYYDARAKMLSFPQLAAGDVLELQYRVEDVSQENLLSDYWGSVDSIQATYPKVRYRFDVNMPKERPLYWNASRETQVTHSRKDGEDGRVHYSWSATHVPKIVPEPMMPGWAEVARTLHVSTYKSWEDVGRYYWGLVRDQLTPNAEIRAATEQALKGVDRKNSEAVVRAIYSFVVTNTRYVALEFGIHGFKPYRVDRVLARRFGDCKDKASLIHSMLQVAGVDSRLVLLRMRNLGELGGEVASLAAFNHAIVYVPQFDLYLDGTAEFHGAKELPSADRRANVLIVEPNGVSPFKTTPEATPADNLSRLQLDVALGTDGSAGIVGRSSVQGQSAPEYRRAYGAQATRRAVFEQGWAQMFPGLSVKRVTLNDTTRLDEAVSIDFEMNAPRFSEANEQMLRFYPFGNGRAYAQSYASLAKRTYDLVMSSPWRQELKYAFTPPEGWRVKELPPTFREQSPFGTVDLSCREDAGRIVCEGVVELSVARVKAADYPAFRAFLGRIDQAFGRKLVVQPAAVVPQQAAR